MKKVLVVILALVLVLSLAACGSGSKETTKSASPQATESELDQVDAQLQGKWKSIDSSTVYSIWTFTNGSYTVDTYVNGELLPNSTFGSYTIDNSAIHTVVESQEEQVEGSIPYTFSDGVLTLNGSNGGLTKQP